MSVGNILQCGTECIGCVITDHTVHFFTCKIVKDKGRSKICFPVYCELFFRHGFTCKQSHSATAPDINRDDIEILLRVNYDIVLEIAGKTPE